MSKPKYSIEVQLSGEDGNGFLIVGRVSKALRRAGVSSEEIEQYREEATAGDYDNLITVTGKWVEVA